MEKIFDDVFTLLFHVEKDASGEKQSTNCRTSGEMWLFFILNIRFPPPGRGEKTNRNEQYLNAHSENELDRASRIQYSHDAWWNANQQKNAMREIEKRKEKKTVYLAHPVKRVAISYDASFRFIFLSLRSLAYKWKLRFWYSIYYMLWWWCSCSTTQLLQKKV